MEFCPRPPLPAGAILLLAAACSGPALAEPGSGLPAEWRGRLLYDDGSHWVLAGSRAAAGDASGLAAEIQESFAEIAGRAPGRGLLVALDPGDPPLFADLDRHEAAVAAWNARAAGESAPEEGAADEETPAAVRAALLGAMALPVPPDGGGLGLPEELLRRAAWIVVVPTQAALEHAAEAMMDLAGEAMASEPDVGLAERAMFAATAPFFERALRGELRGLAQAGVLRTWAAAAEPDPDARRSLFARCCERAGLDPDDAL